MAMLDNLHVERLRESEMKEVAIGNKIDKLGLE
jgi:hypothetical protein